MNKPLSRDEYHKSLAKKRAGTSVIFFDENEKLLILKPNYRDDGWTVPGGVVDENESPKRTAIREVEEEIGVKRSNLDFLLLEYVGQRKDSPEGYEFVFGGGELTKEEMDNLSFAKEEFDDMKFVEQSEAVTLLRPSVARRIQLGLSVMKSYVPLYTEWHPTE